MHIRFVQVELGGGFCPLCIFKLNRVYAIVRIIVILSMNETSLKSSYNKVPRRMKRIMLKFFANLGRVFDRRE